MYRGQTVGVVVPCYNEALQITKVLDTMPEWIDRVIVVDDCSKDQTSAVVRAYAHNHPRVRLITHERNGGVGKAISTGYIAARDEGLMITAVMAGDGQMDPVDLPGLLDPIVDKEMDYCKGNRFKFVKGIESIPRVRLFGNFILSAITKLSSGYWHLSDTQCGYTTITLNALQQMDLENIYPTYGCPNDILTKLNIADMRVGEAAVAPLYNVGEKSKMKIPKIILPILRLLFRNYRQRIFQKYVVRKGHPLVFAYSFSALGFILASVLFAYLVIMTAFTGHIPKAALMFFGFGVITSLHLFLTALEMDYNENKHLQIILPR